MSRRFLPIVTLALCSAGIFLPFQAAKAESVLLTKATVQELRNKVQLLLKGQGTRPARKADSMSPGDALATDRKAFAELRFNDRSLARIGERAIFRFLPNTRTFQLSNGTLLLLIPPGRGQTRVHTPNATAGIRGSALFVRHSPDTNVTLVGALTNSNIEISNENATQPASQSYVLKAGQMAVVVENRIEQIFNFDLRKFYETSEIVKGLDLPRLERTVNSDPDIAAVQAETSEAVSSQPPIVSDRVVENPAFVRLQDAVTLRDNLSLQDRLVRDHYRNTSLVDVPNLLQTQVTSGREPARPGPAGAPEVVKQPPVVVTPNPPIPVSDPTPPPVPVPSPGAGPKPPPVERPVTQPPIERPPTSLPVPQGPTPSPTPAPVVTPPPAAGPTVPPVVERPPVVTPPVVTPTEPPVVVTPPVTPTPPVVSPTEPPVVVTPPVVIPPVVTPTVPPVVVTPPPAAGPALPPVVTPTVPPVVVTPPAVPPVVVTPPVTPTPPVVTPTAPPVVVTPPVVTPPVVTPPVTPTVPPVAGPTLPTPAPMDRPPPFASPTTLPATPPAQPQVQTPAQSTPAAIPSVAPATDIPTARPVLPVLQ